jgi:hypothetical protein
LDAILIIVGGVLFLAGLVLVLIALGHRTSEAPRWPSFNPRDWKPVWKMQDWFDPIGYKLNLAGFVLMMLGVISQIVLRYLEP